MVRAVLFAWSLEDCPLPGRAVERSMLVQGLRECFLNQPADLCASIRALYYVPSIEYATVDVVAALVQAQPVFQRRVVPRDGNTQIELCDDVDAFISCNKPPAHLVLLISSRNTQVLRTIGRARSLGYTVTLIDPDESAICSDTGKLYAHQALVWAEAARTIAACAAGLAPYGMPSYRPIGKAKAEDLLPRLAPNAPFHRSNTGILALMVNDGDNGNHDGGSRDDQQERTAASLVHASAIRVPGASAGMQVDRLLARVSTPVCSKAEDPEAVARAQQAARDMVHGMPLVQWLMPLQQQQSSGANVYVLTPEERDGLSAQRFATWPRVRQAETAGALWLALLADHSLSELQQHGVWLTQTRNEKDVQDQTEMQQLKRICTADHVPLHVAVIDQVSPQRKQWQAWRPKLTFVQTTATPEAA